LIIPPISAQDRSAVLLSLLSSKWQNSQKPVFSDFILLIH
jgi:hypothetical protein